jgi:superfamily II DNA helicase RecQ
VTPLVSLAEDQTDELEARRVAAMRLDSTLCAAEARDATAAIAGGQLELVYCTPERLASRGNHVSLMGEGRELGRRRRFKSRGRNYSWTTAFTVPIEVRVA